MTSSTIMFNPVLAFLLMACPLLDISSYPVTEEPCVHLHDTITCRNANLYHIPYQYIQNKNFSILDLGYNHISLNDIKKLFELKNRAEIKIILFDHNNISHIPSNLFDYLPDLQNLDLSYNTIKHISHWVCNAVNLKEVHLFGNPVEPVSKHVLTCNEGLIFDIELIVKDQRNNDQTESSESPSNSTEHSAIANDSRNTNNKNDTNTEKTKNQTTDDHIPFAEDRNQTDNVVLHQNRNCANIQNSFAVIFVTFIWIIHIFT